MASSLCQNVDGYQPSEIEKYLEKCRDKIKRFMLRHEFKCNR